MVERALHDASATWHDLGAVAVTHGPGLVGSLLVGVSFAKAAAAAAGLPLVGVHHLAGHIESLVLHNGEMPLPAVVLVVSGGHTSLYLVDRPGHYQLLSRTRDDAAGEAYDKVAKLLGLGYPGGPIIDRLAKTGNDRAISLPTTRLTHADRNAPELKGDLDFSFSGLKTAVLRHVKSADHELLQRRSRRRLRDLPAGRRLGAGRAFVRCRSPFPGEEHWRFRRRLSEQPPARGSESPRRCPRDADIRAEPSPVDRQRRDDRRRRTSEDFAPA